MQDLIFITDILSLPRLMELFSESKISRKKLELHLIDQIDITNPDVIEKNVKSKSNSYVFKFDPSTIAFIVMVMSNFHIDKI